MSTVQLPQVKQEGLVMSHVPIATPQSEKLSQPSLALDVDVNIIYMGVVMTIRGDYETIICFFKKITHQKKYMVIIFFVQLKKYFDSIQRLKCCPWHVCIIINYSFISSITEWSLPSSDSPCVIEPEHGTVHRRCPKLCQTLCFVHNEASFICRPKGVDGEIAGVRKKHK